jgi:hypothetical protein
MGSVSDALVLYELLRGDVIDRALDNDPLAMTQLIYEWALPIVFQMADTQSIQYNVEKASELVELRLQSERMAKEVSSSATWAWVAKDEDSVEDTN